MQHYAFLPENSLMYSKIATIKQKMKPRPEEKATPVLASHASIDNRSLRIKSPTTPSDPKLDTWA
jgi:hypothetical protein